MSAPHVIEIAGLCKKFNGAVVLDRLDLSIRGGEIMMIIGSSGVGKTVLLQNIIGLMKPDEGTIAVEGREITGMSEREMRGVRRQIGFMFQGGALFDYMSVGDNLALPLREHTDLPEAEIRARVGAVLEDVDLAGIEDLMPAGLSGGMRKRVGLARALILGPRVVLCDEPTSGLDPVRRTIINNLIVKINAQRQVTMVVTSHDVPYAIDMAHRVAMLHRGKIVALDRSDRIKNFPNEVLQNFINGRPTGEDEAP